MKLSALSTLASGVIVFVAIVVGWITPRVVATEINAGVANAKTVETLRATATRIAEQKERMTPVINVTIPVDRQQMESVAQYAIALHEQAPVIETLGATLPYNTTVYPTFTPSPHVDSSRTPAPVSAGIYAAADTITPAAATPSPQPSAWPSATPALLAIETLEATAEEPQWSVTATPTPYPTEVMQPTITENPTPAPTDVPKSTPWPRRPNRPA